MVRRKEKERENLIHYFPDKTRAKRIRGLRVRRTLITAHVCVENKKRTKTSGFYCNQQTSWSTDVYPAFVRNNVRVFIRGKSVGIHLPGNLYE